MTDHITIAVRNTSQLKCPIHLVASSNGDALAEQLSPLHDPWPSGGASVRGGGGGRLDAGPWRWP